MKKKITILMLIAFILTSVNSNVFAKSNETASSNNKVSKGIGDTIAETFPDPGLASMVAQQTGKTVDDILTQEIIDSINTLSISSNVLDVTGIEVLSNLTFLTFFDYKSPTISDEICSLIKLETFQVNNSKITELPSCIGNLNNLINFALMQTPEITTLPESFGNLTKVTNINIIDSRKLERLPESIGNLTTLDSITIMMTSLKTLPESFGNLPNLRNVSLTTNKIETLPDSLVNLPKLESLVLSTNRITALPENIGNIPTLKALIIDNNQLTSLPNSITNYDFIVGALGNFLPTNFIDVLNENLTEDMYAYLEQNQLTMKTEVAPHTVMNGNDLTTFDFASVLKIVDYTGGETNIYMYPPEPYVLSTTHKYIFDNYVDESGAAVNIEDYIKNGIVQQDVTLFAQIRSTGTGLYQNTSDHAITVDKVQLNLVATPYDLVYDLNGSTETAPASESLVEGTKVTAVEAPVREGYIFKGWNTKADGTGTNWDFTNTTMPAEDVTLFAIWEKEKLEYTLTFDLNGAAGEAPTTQTVLEGEVATAVTDPQRDGYIFKGWNTKADGTGLTWVLGETTMPNQNTILFAIWEDKPTVVMETTPTKTELPATGSTLNLFGIVALVAISVLGKLKMK